MTLLRLSALLVCAWSAVSAQQPFEFFPGGTYDPKIATPASVLGYDIGSHHTDYAGLERWLEAVKKSDRVRVLRYGTSEEKRPLYLIVITSPKNLARLDAVRAAMAKLHDPRAASDAEAAQIAATMPAVAWMNHANDGNESAAFESAIQTSYQLAAGTDQTTTLILDRLVTVVNPAHNPESHERFVTWYNSVQVTSTGTADRQAAEHHAPWGMSTNNNHYQIDLNRDAFFQSQIETRQLVREFGQWNPVVFVDHHGQTKNMFFPPPADAINLNVTPNQLDWMNRYGNEIGEAFDRQGWSYYRRGRFDLFFAGFWDSWPTLNGSIGMTFETDGGGSKGLAWEREDGTILTLRDGVVHHHTGTMAVLKLTAEQKEQRLKDFYQFKKSAIDEGLKDSMRAVVLLPGSDQGRTGELVDILRSQRIEVYRAKLSGAGRASRTFSYFGGTATARDIPAGAYVIPMNQPQKRLARALLEPEPQFTKEFLENERKKKERAELVGERPRDGFYDTTAWTLPLLFGVDAFWSESAIDVGGMEKLPVAAITPVDAPPPTAAGSGIGGPRRPDKARYAYIFTPNDIGSMRLTADLLAEGYNVAVATESFRIEGRDYPRGSVIIRTERNPETLHARMEKGGTGMAGWNVAIHALQSARVQTGPDLGEDPVVELAKPRIAVVTDEPTDDRSYGATWFTLERRLNYPFTAIKTDMLRNADLSRYNVIVFPHGNPATYHEMLGDAGIAKLRRWTQDGGTLVLLKGAAAMATRKGVEWTSSTLKRDEAEVRLFFDQPPGPEAAAKSADGKPADEKPLDRPLTRDIDFARTPGAILRVKVDPQHFLGFGYDRDTAATVQSNYAFTISRTGQNAAAFPDAKTVKLAGFMWPEMQEAMARTLYAWVEPAGRGNTILFADDPNFRATQLSTLRLFFNAVFLGPSFARRF